MKKLLVVLLTIAMVFGLVGCSSSSNSGDDSTSDSSQTNTIKIGGSGPTSGSAAQYGRAVYIGAQVAVNEINEAAGEDGLKLELNFQDDEADGEKATNAYNQLLDWGMQVSMLCTTTGSSLAVSSLYNDAGIFAMSPSASAEDVIANKDYAYRMCFADPEQGTAAAEYIAEHSLGSNIAIFYQNDDEYSTGIYGTFVSKAQELGLTIAYEYAFAADNNTDFSSAVTSAKSAGADVVFLPLYYENDYKIISECNSQDFKPVFFGVDGFDGALDMENVDTSLLEGVYYLTPFAYSSQDEATQNFVAKFKELYNETYGEDTNPNQFAADAYDVVKALYNAMVEAGVTADMSAQDIGEKLIATFTGGFTYSGLTGENMTWTDGAVVKLPQAFKVENGQLVAA